MRQDEQGTAVPPSPSATPTMMETAVSSPTATALPTNTPQPTFTPTPTSTIEVGGGFVLQPTPTVFLVTTPNSSSDSYQLQLWDEPKAEILIQSVVDYAENIDPVIDTVANWRENYAYAQSIVEMTIYEDLLRFPETPNRENLEWRLAYAKAMQGEPETTTFIIDLLEAGFANGRYTLNNLDDILRSHRFAIRENGYKPYPKETTYLFGRNEITDLRLITTMQYENSPASDGVLAAFSRDNPPEITPITSVWSQGFGSFSQIALQDLTNDNQPEVIMDWNISSGGLPCHYLNIWQWQGDGFFEFDESHSLLGCRSSLELDLSNKNSIRVMTTELFPGDTITQTFHWDGSTFTFSPEQSPIPQDPNPTANPYYSLFYDNEALIEVKNRIIENWTDEWSDKFGASFPDALRIQQAMLYLSLNQEGEAQILLNNVVESPINLEASTISAIAKAYLDAYQSSEDTFLACTQALQVLDDLIQLHTIDGIIDYQSLNTTAGFNVYPDRLIFICSPLQSLEDAINAWNFDTSSSEKSIFEFLAKNQIVLNNSIPLDLNGNGIEDWLMVAEMIDPGHSPQKYILAFLNSSDRFVMLPVSSISKHDLDDLTINTMKLPDYEYPIHILTSLNRPKIFAVESSSDVPKLKEWLRYENLYGSASYKLQQHEDGNVELIISYESRPYLDYYREAVYRWNSETQDFELMEKRADNSLGIPLDEAITQAETLLFQEGDFEAAIPILTAVLTELNAAEELTWAIPRSLYLLGLAYELSDDETNAVDTYWSLWQTYPESPYALLAQAKIELKP